MSRLIDLLKANGAKDTDLEQMKPLLDNQVFATKLEAELEAKYELEKNLAEAGTKYNELESIKNQAEAQRDDAAKKEQELRAWWETQAAPRYEQLRQETVQAVAAKAALEARLAKAKEVYGIEFPADPAVETNPTISNIPTGATVPGTGASATTQAKVDMPDLTNYVTKDYFVQQADMVGDAIALAQDLAAEHSQLFGSSKPMNFGELRKKAAAERQSIRAVWERDYGVGARKAELQAAAQAADAKKRADELEAARLEGYQKGISEVHNPMTRAADAGVSNVGFAFSTKKEGSNPWDASSSVKMQDRAQKVISHLAKQGAA